MRYVKPLSLFQDLVRGNALERGRLLGLDVGDKYVGVAVSDIHNKIASPLSVLLRKKSTLDMMADDFQSLISELSLEGFIVGYPFDRQRRSPDAVQVKLFIDDLSATRKLEGLKYTYWDEGFTSKNVELLLRPLNLHPVTSKTIIDKFAAVGILQGYLDYVNRKQKSVTAQNFGKQTQVLTELLKL
ncbi:PREDICTED: Holliday junction [Prunus dulcis]|uniref:PREDICTED: Holliday junction n=1 Tax=Prunus dulcis TaxID=3755 RepID=A0A5E4FRH2_PRUDU|nr:putative pre-16S rRNA nuclease isoform X1 [Prunus dulcis]VVA30091.1 PREDICTED: Holliday junction [Prunus dulcis]